MSSNPSNAASQNQQPQAQAPATAHEPTVISSLKRLEQRARKSFERLPYPTHLEELFVKRVQRLRGAFDFATKADVKMVSERIEQLHEKMDHFVRASRKATPSSTK